MSTASGNYALLIEKIDEFIRKYYLNKVVRGCIYLAASFFAAYLLVTVAEYYGNFDPPVRVVIFYSFLLLNLFILAFYLVIPLISYTKLGKRISHEQASAIIGNHFKPVKDKLLNTLQLKKLADESPVQQSLIEASIDQKISELRPVPFSNAVHISENRKYLKYALIPLSVIVLIFFTAPSIFSESTERLLKYNTRFVKKAPFSFVILNDKLNAVQGSDFELKVKLTGDQIPQDLYLEDGVNTFKLEKESIIRFHYTFKNLQSNKTIRLTSGEFSSKEYELKVQKKPSLLKFTVDLDYPAYLNKKDEQVSNSGDLTVPAGTNMKWKFEAENTDQLELNFNKQGQLLSPSGNNEFRFAHRAMRNTSYAVRPVNSAVNNTEGISYQLTVVPDLHPSIEVNEKRDSVNTRLLYFVGQVNDDHGFSGLRFNYRVLNKDAENSRAKKSISIPLSSTTLQSSFSHFWDAGKADAQPGDQIEYYFEVYDNDGVNGAKVTRSPVKTFNLLTEKQIDQKLQANSTSIKKKMEQAIKQATQVEKEAKRMNQDLLNKKSLNYDDKKQLEALLEKQKDLENLVKEIQEANKQDLFEQQENKEVREDILEKQKQIEDLFNNVLDEKTREILRNIEKLLEQNNKNMTQDELSKMQVDNKSLKKELDRILELYKQLEFEQKLTETTEKLKDLAKEQKDLSNETAEKNADAQQLKEEQQKLSEEFKAIKEDLKSLEAKNEQLEQKNDFESPEQEQQDIEQDQQESSKNLDKKNLKKASDNQRQAADKMQKLSQKLESMQQEGEEEENDINIQALREILDNLIATSFDQEKIMQTLKSINTADPNYISNTQKQKDIKDNLKMIEDSLYSLSKKVPQIQSVVNKEVQTINSNISNALDNLAERRTAEANRNQQYAMTSINNLALMLSEALDQMQRAQRNAQSGGKGKKQSLSQLSKMQEALNKNMQKAREQMQKEGQQGQQGQQKPGKGQMSEQLAKMAREQQMIRQGMQEINRELNKDGQKGLGNLDKLMKEMEQTETDLVNKKIHQETINRQQEILTKLLEAEKAEREREQDQQRESKRGIDQPSNYNNFMKEFKSIKQQETELLRTVPPSLNSFYKIKVGDYFKFLNSGNNDK